MFYIGADHLANDQSIIVSFSSFYVFFQVSSYSLFNEDATEKRHILEPGPQAIRGRRGGRGGSSPSGIAPLPHSNFELPWSGNFLIFMTFPPSPPPSLEKIFFPALIPPLQKIFASLPYSPSLENFSSLSYSPLCKFFFAPCPIPPSLRIFSFPVLIPPLKP